MRIFLRSVWSHLLLRQMCFSRFVLNYPLQTESDLATLSLHEPSPEEKDEAERLKNKGGWRRMDLSHFASLFETLHTRSTKYIFVHKKKVTDVLSVVRKMRQSNTYFGSAIFHIIFGVK